MKEKTRKALAELLAGYAAAEKPSASSEIATVDIMSDGEAADLYRLVWSFSERRMPQQLQWASLGYRKVSFWFQNKRNRSVDIRFDSDLADLYLRVWSFASKKV